MTDEYERILAQLREDWPRQQVFYAEHVAVVLAKTPKAVTRMRERNRLDVGWSRLGGRYYCRLHDLAAFLAGMSEAPKPKPGRPSKVRQRGEEHPRRPALGPICVAMGRYIGDMHPGMSVDAIFWEEVLGHLQQMSSQRTQISTDF